MVFLSNVKNGVKNSYFLFYKIQSDRLTKRKNGNYNKQKF